MHTSDPAYYVDGVLAGRRRPLAQTITLLESTLVEHRALAEQVARRLLERSGGAVRLGVSGVPGVGKSTFVEALGTLLLDRGHRVAVLAVDPSSSRSRGSVMADKTRMERLAADPRAFIRPSPAGGALGGVARKTRETLMVCEAAGFDVVLVETVGVGQSETAVAGMVDFFLLLMLAGAGDELQGIKRGVLELADALVINKADGANRDAAHRARRVYQNALHLLRPASPNWRPPVLTVSALENRGIEGVWDIVQKHRERLTRSGELAERRRTQAVEWMWALIEEGLRDRFRHHPRIAPRLERITREVAHGTITAPLAAERLLFSLDNDPAVQDDKNFDLNK